MTVADSPICVAYHFREKRAIISWALTQRGFEYTKGYVLWLIDKANKTKKQKSIQSEIMHCRSDKELLSIVDRVIINGSNVEFTDYSKQQNRMIRIIKR